MIGLVQAQTVEQDELFIVRATANMAARGNTTVRDALPRRQRRQTASPTTSATIPRAMIS
jgi:hypothetical protein